MDGCDFAICISVSMSNFKIENIEVELKKRLPYDYNWGQKQNDLWDGYTNFIYKTWNWEELVLKMKQAILDHKLDKRELFNYAANRWFNFWSSQAVEQIFTAIEGVEPVVETTDSEKDFYLFGIPFDHKTSIFPKQFQNTYEYAHSHKPELIEWLYKNQSTQKRHHFKNRLFIVVYAKNGEHWKLKAEISLLKEAIQKYVASFRKEQLHSFTFADEQTTLSDIIWVSK
ncbi:hypothetical protein Aeqsu_1187 [Aequorivita sublithincola DSM 14238]|uniref:Uncharacterized protein n=2 Tax=Aequorivita TaxID=153265 RepID=I3YUL5_AEQSU|nr:hypothetical protein Aeqsu_1187 [Aequorivita sublithincola DSM 14238]